MLMPRIVPQEKKPNNNAKVDNKPLSVKSKHWCDKYTSTRDFHLTMSFIVRNCRDQNNQAVFKGSKLLSIKELPTS